MIHYPEYIPVFDQNKPRQYPTESELIRTNTHLNGMSKKERKKAQRHHIDLDRSNGKAENLHVVDPETHTQLHQQLQSLLSVLIKKEIIGYNRRNPHYYIKDEAVKSKLNLKPSKVIKDNFKVERVKRKTGNILAQSQLKVAPMISSEPK